MTILCVACRRHIQIPEERAGNPRLKVKCGCGTVFMLQEAPIASAAAVAAAASPAPVPASAAPEPPSRVSFQATAASGASPSPEFRPRAGVLWRRCTNHSGTRSESVCQKCGAGYCRECEQKVQNAVMCPKCEALCVPANEWEERLDRDRLRARPMMDELNTILTYPLRDTTAFVSLAVFTWVFAALGQVAVMYGKAVGIIFSQGVLMAYCFTALSRASSGNLKDFMPDISDIHDLIRALRLGFAALLAGSGPLLLIVILIPGLALLGGVPSSTPSDSGGEMPEESDAGPGVALFLLGLIALVWKVGYTPMALTVAGLSRSVWSTLNPAVGIDTIRRMDTVYWHAMGIYTVVAFTQWVLGAILSYIPILGGLIRSFVDAYAYLMIGCALGLAVFKKAPELGLE